MKNCFAKAFLLALIAAVASWLCLPKLPLLEGKTYSTAYLDRQGELLRLTLAEDDRYRLYTPLDQIAPVAQAATLLYEDQYFHHHFGVNLAALWRAFWETYVAGGRRVGASTITMQVARICFNIDSHTLPGKLQQIFYALRLERHYSKTEILQAYLNVVSYGGNIDGIGAASRIYFHKPAADLTLPEALALAVIPQNPVRRNPQSVAGFAEMMEARQRLFQRWRQVNPPDPRAELWLSLPLALHTAAELPFHAPHFVTGLNLDFPLLSGAVHTSLDLDQQRLLERRVREYIEQHRQQGIHNAAALLLDHRSMQVKAWLGSADFHDRGIFGQVDGVQARRSPGSALKPFVYALALDQGQIHPMSLLKDAPKRYGAYTPENFDQVFIGPLSATEALITSRNVPAVNLQARLQRPDFYGFLRQAGVEGLQPAAHYGLALALGGMEISMEKLAELYALLPNAGRQQPLQRLRESADHSRLRQTSSDGRLLSPEAAFLTLHMLRQNPAPDERVMQAALSARPSVAWKTGTSFAFRDAWAVGVAGPYVLAVWVGNFDGAGNPNFIGRTAAGPLLFTLLRDLYARRPWPLEENSGEPSISPPHLNIAAVDICAPTGDLPGRHCPQTKKSWFIPGVSPIKVSNVHRAVPIDKKTGRRACWYDPAATRLEVFEFWPSDIERIFRQAGIQRRRPPPLREVCAGGTGSPLLGSVPPEIQSPVDRLVYSLQSHQLEKERIAFQAVFDGDVKTAHWFVGNRYVGSAKAGEVFWWRPDAGRFEVRVVDDRGLVDKVDLEVQVVR